MWEESCNNLIILQGNFKEDSRYHLIGSSMILIELMAGLCGLGSCIAMPCVYVLYVQEKFGFGVVNLCTYGSRPTTIGRKYLRPLPVGG